PKVLGRAFTCQGIRAGLDGDMMYVPFLGIVAHYFVRSTLAMSIVTAGVSLGFTVSPVMIHNLLEKTTWGLPP
ncbi:hypothetical protein P691DRAFT_682698, partial [Macrolepiota fuliginosa MF-IS2]